MQVTDRNARRRITVILAVVCCVLQLALAPNVGIGNGRINFMLVLAACIALSLPRSVSDALLSCAGYTLFPNRAEENIYAVMLDHASELDVDQCNALLIGANLKPLYAKRGG